MNAQDKLNKRFADKHSAEFEDNWLKKPFTYSSWALMFKVKDHEHVIDVGCGTNPFKGKIKHLVGVDPVKINNPNVAGADVVSPIEDFETDEKFDVAFCLGSIQFGDEAYITKQIDKVNSLLKPTARVYWRHRIGGIATHPLDNNEVHDEEYYVWTFDRMEMFAKKYGFEQTNCQIDKNLKTDDERLYCEWHRG